MPSAYTDILFRDSLRRHSADVRIELRLDGRVLPVAQAGPDRLSFDQAVLLPDGPAELAITVDGRERRWHVTLHPGPAPSRIVPTETISDA
jgi:hypothetical protein